MNRFDWIDDAAIAAAFEHRAMGGSSVGLREAVIAKTANAPQVGRNRWLQMPELGRPPRTALVLLAVIASLLGVLLAILIAGRSTPVQRLGLLVYTRDGDVFVAEPDGSHAVQVAHDDAIAFSSPVWSPAGRWVALGGGDNGEFLLDTESVTIRRLPGRAFAAWSTDGHQLALIADEPSGPVNDQSAQFVRIVNVDTDTARDIRAPTGESIGGQIAWSPDGRWFLAEVSAVGGAPGADREWFARIDAAVGTVQKIEALHHLNHADAAWAHDGVHFVYTSHDPCPEPGCKGAVIVADAALQTRVTLGDAAQDAGSAIWSPDDQWLAFKSGPFPASRICCDAVPSPTISISHPDGSGLRVLLVDPPPQASFSWNADGTGVEYTDGEPTAPGTEVNEVSLADGTIKSAAPHVAPPSGVDTYAWQTIVGDAPIPDLPRAVPAASRAPLSGPALAEPAPAPKADPSGAWRGLGLSNYCSAGVVSFATGDYTVVGTECNEGPGAYWSPIGGAYAIDNLDGTLTITRPDGTTMRTPAPPDPALVLPVTDIAWSPNGSWLSYIVEGLDPQSLTASAPAFVMVGADGTGVRTLPGRPSWSPDGSHMAVQDTTGQLLAGHADGADFAPIGALPPPVTWAPDGDAFAFVRDGDVWTVGIDGDQLRNLTEFPLGGASGAAWSPDGRSIVVLQGSQLWLISTDGTRMQSMQADDRNIFENVVWSPDGSRFSVSPAGRRVAIIEIADWSGALLETSGRIIWSPDSRFAAFLDFGGLVSIANADGSGFRQLWTTTGDIQPASALAWLP
jgi:hypothetical protein